MVSLPNAAVALNIDSGAKAGWLAEQGKVPTWRASFMVYGKHCSPPWKQRGSCRVDQLGPACCPYDMANVAKA
ncbi:hypothetical protein ABBQ32_011663 [Trebouxia sp. C0010 RCD-2024]